MMRLSLSDFSSVKVATLLIKNVFNSDDANLQLAVTRRNCACQNSSCASKSNYIGEGD